MIDRARYATCTHCKARVRIDTEEGAEHVAEHEPRGSYAERKQRRIDRARRALKYMSVPR